MCASYQSFLRIWPSVDSLALVKQMRRVLLSLAQSHAQPLVLVQQFLDCGSFVGQIDAKDFTLLCQVCNIFAQLVAIKRELPELLIFIGQGLVIRLELLDFVLRERYDVDVAGKCTAKVSALFSIAVIHHAGQSLHHAESVIVSPEGQSQFLRLAIVAEQLLVLVTEVVDHVFVLQCALRQLFEPLGGLDCSS